MKNAEKTGDTEAQRLRGRVGPEDAEEVAGPVSEHVCLCVYMHWSTRVSILVLLVEALLVGWFSKCGPLGAGPSTLF